MTIRSASSNATPGRKLDKIKPPAAAVDRITPAERQRTPRQHSSRSSRKRSAPAGQLEQGAPKSGGNIWSSASRKRSNAKTENTRFKARKNRQPINYPLTPGKRSTTENRPITDANRTPRTSQENTARQRQPEKRTHKQIKSIYLLRRSRRLYIIKYIYIILLDI